MDERQQNSRQLPRLSLKGLFALVAAVAIVLAPYYWFGGFYLYSAGCSFLFIYLYTWRYREGRVGVFTSIAIAAIAILLAEMGIATIVFFVQAMLTAAVCIPLASRKVRPHTFAIVLVALMAAIYGVAFANGAAAMRKMRVLRAQYPFTSLETRLAFERAKQSESAPSINPATFSSAVAKHLNEQDDAQEFRYYTRARALRVLHESSYQEFALAAGYGSARMPFVSMGSVNLNPAAEFKLPTPLAIHHMEAPAQELFDAHNTAVDDFISP